MVVWPLCLPLGKFRSILQLFTALAFLPRETSAENSEFLIQPKQQFVRAGSSVEFKVEPAAPALATFQWERNGILIPGATNSTLTLTNVQVLNDGTYTASILTGDRTVKANSAALTVCWQSEFFSVQTNLPPPDPIPPALTDSLGNVYSGIFSPDSPASARRTNDFMITKSDSNGNVLWTSGPADPQKAITPNAGVIDHENNLILAARTRPVTVAKFTPDGENLWTVQVDDFPSEFPFVHSLMVDGANNILVTSGVSSIEINAAFVSTSQLSPEGHRNWTIRPPIYTYYGVTGLPVVAVDSESNFYMFGYVAQVLFIQNRRNDLVLVKYDNLGRVLWTNVTHVTVAGFSTEQTKSRLYPGLMRFENDLIKVLGTHSGVDGDQIFELTYRQNALPGLPITVQTPGEKRLWDTEPLVLEIGALGADPLNIQWLKGGSPIPGQTNKTLTLTNPQATDSGTYALFVSNAVGCALSGDIPVTITHLVRPRLEVPSGPVRLITADGPSYVFIVRAEAEPGTYCYLETSYNFRDWFPAGGGGGNFQIGPDGHGSSTNVVGYGATPPQSRFFRVSILP